jgi:hypothetical protein
MTSSNEQYKLFIKYYDGSGRISHKLDGPIDNHWYINGFRITDEIHEWAQNRHIDLNNLSPEDKCAIALEWGNYDGESTANL